MTLGLFFWILVLFAVVGGIYFTRPSCPPNHRPWGWWFLFVLVLALGWEVFGPALHR